MNAEDGLRANFGKIWPTHVASLTCFLIDCRAAFDGDLEMFLVLSVIGDRTFSSRHADPSLDFDTFQDTPPMTPAENINIRSIADFSGIPRETVRRKVEQLTGKGWVTRNGDGYLVATEKAKRDLLPLTNVSIRYLAKMSTLLREV